MKGSFWFLFNYDGFPAMIKDSSAVSINVSWQRNSSVQGGELRMNEFLRLYQHDACSLYPSPPSHSLSLSFTLYLNNSALFLIIKRCHVSLPFIQLRSQLVSAVLYVLYVLTPNKN